MTCCMEKLAFGMHSDQDTLVIAVQITVCLGTCRDTFLYKIYGRPAAQQVVPDINADCWADYWLLCFDGKRLAVHNPRACYLKL